MNSLPLTNYPAGSRVRIAGLDGGCKARAHLCSLGLTPGTLVEVCSCGAGPCRLRVRESDLIIGHGLAEKILAVDTP
ncbi:MAG: ferrous iron transport protein A [Desulfovibrionales bacterium]